MTYPSTGLNKITPIIDPDLIWGWLKIILEIEKKSRIRIKIWFSKENFKREEKQGDKTPAPPNGRPKYNHSKKIFLEIGKISLASSRITVTILQGQSEEKLFIWLSSVVDIMLKKYRGNFSKGGGRLVIILTMRVNFSNSKHF